MRSDHLTTRKSRGSGRKDPHRRRHFVMSDENRYICIARLPPDRQPDSGVPPFSFFSFFFGNQAPDDSSDCVLCTQDCRSVADLVLTHLLRPFRLFAKSLHVHIASPRSSVERYTYSTRRVARRRDQKTLQFRGQRSRAVQS